VFIAGAENFDKEVHISLDEYETSGSNSTIGLFTNDTWGIWSGAHAPSIGSCIGVKQRLLIVVSCAAKLPFVCEVYVKRFALTYIFVIEIHRSEAPPPGIYYILLSYITNLMLNLFLFRRIGYRKNW
jgi:hypothetical protein